MNKESKTLLIIGIIVVVLVGGVTAAMNLGNTGGQIDPKILMGENSHMKGNGIANYKVTIVEFADFQCPACAFMHNVMKNILASTEGKVNLIFRHFPLQGHKNAVIAALASEAAGEQGKFWEMYDLLYEKQSEWAESTAPMNNFMTYAEQIGLNRDKFRQDMEAKKNLDRINQDLTDGIKVQVSGTPTLFINGKKYNKALSLPALLTEIDNELKAIDSSSQVK